MDQKPGKRKTDAGKGRKGDFIYIYKINRDERKWTNRRGANKANEDMIKTKQRNRGEGTECIKTDMHRPEEVSRGST